MANYKKLRARLMEAQNCRCAACVRLLDDVYFSDDIFRQSIVKIDKSLPVSYNNTIIMCGRCSGYAANYPDLLTFYENYIIQKKGRNIKQQTEYPETIRMLNALLEKENIELLSENSKYKFAPPDKVPHIIPKLIKKFKEQPPRFNKRKVSREGNNAQQLLEAQNHRCCYCHCRFEDHPKSTRYATFEHVINRRDGGTNSKSNLVMACAICNSVRDHTKLSAEDFYYWVQNNMHVITQKDNQIKNARKSRRAWQEKLKEMAR